jgi:hypothetical protein
MTAKLLLELARELGLPMGGMVGGKHVGYTTNRAAAEELYRNGATVASLPAAGAPNGEGFDVSFRRGSVAAPRTGPAA